MVCDCLAHEPDHACVGPLDGAGRCHRTAAAAHGVNRVAAVLLAVLVAASCTTDVDLGDGVRRHGDHLYTSEGPELEVVLATRQASSSLGDQWLVLAAEFRSTSRSGPLTVSRSDISVRTPDGRQLRLVDQQTYRTNFGRVRVAVERALASLPRIGRFETAQMPCERWFLTDPFGRFASDDVYLNTFQTCWGPLVFYDATGIQPGAWRFIVELEESRVDIPFEVEAPE